ncbi:branched-chain amino acid transporter [Acinetobacter sp. ANC 4470]|uniref:AzlD domain-containing protein n=1 Tax=Acinetobacter sp. ANC 4470 TaxID=1977881 RepID=UPI000A33E653|nr:AzlD domain-containing protein [Acinetobacter sp. ANC 4470]OTG69129.1 branched-chain amino acid transporter [Acinetobacter sp. ANC 4470]
MTWTYIFILAGIVFFNRYFFLEPRVDVKFPHFFEKMLKYSAPCLLTAICAPIIFYQDDAFRAFPNNPYLYGAIFCVFMILWLKKTLLSIIFSLVFFYMLTIFMPS